MAVLGNNIFVGNYKDSTERATIAVNQSAGFDFKATQSLFVILVLVVNFRHCCGDRDKTKSTPSLDILVEVALCKFKSS